MNFNFTKVLAQLFLLLWREILVSEKHHTAFRNQESQLISLLVCQVFELQPDNLGSNMAGQVYDFFGRAQERLLLWVGASSGVDIFPGLAADFIHVVEVQRLGWVVGIAVGKVDAGFGVSLAGGLRDVQAMVVLLRLDDEVGYRF